MAVSAAAAVIPQSRNHGMKIRNALIRTPRKGGVGVERGNETILNFRLRGNERKRF
jgi:hypothetical protein